MGRPRLYNTPEQKKAAKAANSKRSYQRFVVYCVPVKKFLKTLADTEITLMNNGR
jgi:hypothetical protein